MPSENSGKTKYSVQLVFFSIYFLLITLTVGLLNTYPTISSREAVFSVKRSLMVNQATVMASSLSVLESLGEESVEQIMELININEFDRVVVTDGSGKAIYDTAESDNAEGLYTVFPEVIRALGGEIIFRCRYDGKTFLSRTAMPVVSYGETKGAVYLFERDSTQADMIRTIQVRLRNISAIVGAVSLLAVFAFTKALTHRITELVKAMRIVREGDYEYRIPVRGRDEVAELSEEFNDMTGRLQSTEELRRRFVSDASHELRTPLASIRLLSDSIVQSENMDEETMREFVADIGSEAERLQRMTEKLMKLTRMDARAPVQRGRIDAGRVAEKTLHLLSPLAKEKNVTIFSELGEGCFVFAPEDDIYQIIFNLAENAIKYNTFGGNAFIKLSHDGENVTLTVEDTGIGIPDEDVPHIFSRFYRVDKARSSEVGGSGLGLSIVSDAVRQNGGEIKVERRETTGTRFVVTFPLEKGEEQE